MRFYVIYEYTDEYSRSDMWEDFESLEESEDFIRSTKGDWHYSKVIGPLFLARSLDKEEKSGVLEKF